MPECDVPHCPEPGVQRITHPTARLETRWLCREHLSAWLDANPETRVSPSTRRLLKRRRPRGEVLASQIQAPIPSTAPSSPSAPTQAPQPAPERAQETAVSLTASQKRILLSDPVQHPVGWQVFGHGNSLNGLVRRGFIDKAHCLTEQGWAFRAEHGLTDPRQSSDAEAVQAEPPAEQVAIVAPAPQPEAAEGPEDEHSPVADEVAELHAKVADLEQRLEGLRGNFNAVQQERDEAKAKLEVTRLDLGNLQAAVYEGVLGEQPTVHVEQAASLWAQRDAALKVVEDIWALLDPQEEQEHTPERLLAHLRLLLASDESLVQGLLRDLSGTPLTFKVEDAWLDAQIGGLRVPLATWDETTDQGGEATVYHWTRNDDPITVPVHTPEEAVAVVRALLGVRGVEVPDEVFEVVDEDDDEELVEVACG